jgi:hypothetical protein
MVRAWATEALPTGKTAHPNAVNNTLASAILHFGCMIVTALDKTAATRKSVCVGTTQSSTLFRTNPCNLVLQIFNPYAKQVVQGQSLLPLRSKSLLAPPALGECRHRRLARFGIAMCGRSTGKGQYIEIEPEELEAIAIESKRTIEIDEFVPKKEIDELFLNSP